MTPVTVKIFGELYKYMPNKLDWVTLNISPGTTIRGLVNQLGIPDYAIWVITVNGHRHALDYALQANDTVAIFSPVGGG